MVLDFTQFHTDVLFVYTFHLIAIFLVLVLFIQYQFSRYWYFSIDRIFPDTDTFHFIPYFLLLLLFIL